MSRCRPGRAGPLAVAFGLAAVLGGCGGAGKCQLSLATTLPITLAEDGRRLLVPARLGDRDMSLIVDTGSMLTMISRSSLPVSQFVRGSLLVRGVGGGRVTRFAQLQQLSLGRLRGAVPAAVTDQTFDVDHQAQDGLLGMDILGAYEVDLDVPGRQLRLYKSSGDCSRPAASLQQPLYAVNEPAVPERIIAPRVQVTIQGQTFLALLDSGAPMTAMFRTAAGRLGIGAAAMAGDRTALALGVGTGAEQAHLHMVDVIRVGELDIRHVPVDVIDQDLPTVDLLLGMDFMQRVHVWISSASHTIVMQYPPQVSPMLPPAFQ